MVTQMARSEVTTDEVLRFWYEEAGPERWYVNDPAFDAEIRERFATTYEAAAVGELSGWRDGSQGRLAEVIVLDQFPRNMFRESPRAYLADPIALVLAQEAVRLRLHEELGERRAGILMPYMHSESRRVHEEAIELFAGTPSFDFEVRHKAIIDRFGRYPHRNAALGRESTPAEVEFLAGPDSGF